MLVAVLVEMESCTSFCVRTDWTIVGFLGVTGSENTGVAACVSKSRACGEEGRDAEEWGDGEFRVAEKGGGG